MLAAGTDRGHEVLAHLGAIADLPMAANCAGAKHIIAINTDPGAPILAHADYAVLGDLHQVIPVPVEALRGNQHR